MKKVFLAGSRRYYEEIEDLILQLKNADIPVSKANKEKDSSSDTLKSENEALLRAFRLIDKSDILYIYAHEGYAGKTVLLEIAYAYAKGKLIISSEELTELSARALVDQVLKPNELITFCLD